MRESDKALAHTGMTRTANSLIRRLPRPGSIRGEAAGAWVDLILIVFGLAVVGIGALIYLSSLPHRCCDSPSNRRNACIANLKQIEGAKSTWALEFAKGTNDVPVAADLFGQARILSASRTVRSAGLTFWAKLEMCRSAVWPGINWMRRPRDVRPPAERLRGVLKWRMSGCDRSGLIQLQKSRDLTPVPLRII